MEIKIEVPEDKFKDVLQKELNAFTDKELHIICKQGLLNCMSDVNMINEILGKKDSYYSSESKYEKILYEAVRNNLNFEPMFKEIETKILNYVRENYDNIIKKMILDLLMNGLGSNVFHSQSFQSELSKVIYDMECNINQNLDQRLNNRQY